MNNLISLLKKDLIKLIIDLQNKKIIGEININNISIDYSSKSKQGDLSTNIFIIINKKNINNNFDLKDYITKYLSNLEYVSNIEIVKAGFVNINFQKNYLISMLENLTYNKLSYPEIKKEKINIEFVSANPTGPIHIAHLRGAITGDVLASILESVGHEVTREYYVNDAGAQIHHLANSIFKRYQELFGHKIQIIKDEYPGEYLIEIANQIKKLDNDKWIYYKDEDKKLEYFKNYGVNYLLSKIKEDLSLIDIKFDKFTYESEIIKNNLIKKVFSILKEKNLLYEGFLEKPKGEEDKKWKPRSQLLFRSTKFSDDIDRPFQKANGEWTYFANDSAYHYNKFSRGYDQLINIWGADHIGYIQRMKSIVAVISNKKNFLDIHVCQLVRLFKNGELLKMSKRDGNFITIKEIFEDVGKDALRYFMISSKSESPMELDMKKIIEKNKDNPVFYCQYAYARASSILSKTKSFKNLNIDNLSFQNFDINSISEYEWNIIIKLLIWPYVLFQSSITKQPHRITIYLEDICHLFHSFWNKGKDDENLRFIDENNLSKTITKIIWIQSFRKILKEVFLIIGIQPLDSM